MARRCRLPRFSRGILYVIVSAALLPVLLSLGASQGSADLYDNFENIDHTGWVYAENDYYDLLSGAHATYPVSEGENSYVLSHATGHTEDNDVVQISRNIDFTHIDNISFEIWVRQPSGYFGQKYQVWIDDNLIYQVPDQTALANPTAIDNIENDVTAFTGAHDLIFKIDFILDRPSQDENCDFWIDSLHTESGLRVDIVSVDNALIDRKLDYPTSGAELDTEITVRVSDNEGHGGIMGAYISIWNNTDGLVVDNVQLTDNTEVDDNTLEFTYTYDPADALSDASLGPFGIYVYAEDNIGRTDTDNQMGLFTVDDLNIPVILDNALPWYTYNITVSGTISRVSGGTASVDNAWVIDTVEGTFVQGAGNSYSETYTVNSSFSTSVTVTGRALDSPLDGETENTYVVSENRIHNWWLRYEENAEPYDLMDNWSYRFNIYYVDGTGESVAITDNEGTLALQKEVYDIALEADNDLSNDYDHFRTLVPGYPENLYFYLVGPEDITSTNEYIFTLEDYTGLYGPDENGIIAFQKTPDNLATITEDRWGVGPSVNVWLIQETRYQIVLYGNSGRTRVLGYVWATSVFSRTLTVRPLTPENATYIRDYLTWSAWRNENAVNVTYTDSYENTDNVTIEIYIMLTDNLQFQTTEYTDSIEVEWVSSDNDSSYRIELTANHGTFGIIAENKLVGPNIMAYQTDVPDVGDPIGSPIALLSIFSVGILAIVGLTTGARYAAHSMFAMAGITTYLTLVGWLQIDWKIVGFLWTLAIIAYLGRSKG